jgi:UDP-N-acetylmuramyl pentapeptide phosphotransferase/UDP-N-acetylglucosamine-1-phosphate transferase
VPKQFFAHKNKTIWIATVNYQRIAKKFNFFEKRQDRQPHSQALPSCGGKTWLWLVT